MNCDENPTEMSYTALRHAHDHLEITRQLLLALLAGEQQSYHNSRTETYRNLLNHIAEAKKSLPGIEQQIPF